VVKNYFTVVIINIRGIRSVIPNKSGKNSNVTVRILCGGFHDSTKVKLMRTGSADLIPKRTFVENSGSIRTSFEFRNAPTGFWTVVLTLPNGDTMSLRNGFEIQDTAKPDLWVKISGDRIYRPGFQANYTISYGNNGNSDAKGVFVFLRGLPRNCKIFILNDSIDVKRVPPFDTLRRWADSIPNEFLDSATLNMFTGAFLPSIPAGSTGTIRVKIIVPTTIDVRRQFEVQASLSAPSLTEQGDECLQSVGEAAEWGLRQLFEETLGDVLNCWAKLVLLPRDTRKVFIDYSESTKTAYDKIVLIKDFASTIASTLYSCKEAGFIALPVFKLPKAISIIVGVLEEAGGIEKVVRTFYPVGLNCGKFGAIAIDKIISGTGYAFDPNIKLGPGEGSLAHFFSSPSRIMPYTIMCENDSMATLPAQIITIIDTLDKTKLDAASVGFTFVNLSDKTATLPNAPQ
jgi:hypothetical protein